MFDHVYAEPHATVDAERAWFERYEASFLDAEANAMTTMTLAGAINAGLRKAMERDPKVLSWARTSAPLGGVFRVTDGLHKDFGADRVIDTPLAESGIIGTAIGMSMRGYRPVVRDPVRRLHLPGVRPDHHPAREDALPVQGPRSQLPVSSACRSPAASAPWSITPRAPRCCSPTPPAYASCPPRRRRTATT